MNKDKFTACLIALLVAAVPSGLGAQSFDGSISDKTATVLPRDTDWVPPVPAPPPGPAGDDNDPSSKA